MAVNLDPGTIGGVVGGLIPAAVIGAGWLARVIFKNRKAVAKGVAASLDLKLADGENSGEMLTTAILQLLKSQEADRHADRAERARQWERIEESLALAKEHAQAAWAINQTIQNFGNWMNEVHKQQDERIRDIAKNQIHISNYLRERLGGGTWPSQHPRPPMTGGN